MLQCFELFIHNAFDLFDKFLAVEALLAHDESDAFLQSGGFVIGQFFGADDNDGALRGWRAAVR